MGAPTMRTSCRRRLMILLALLSVRAQASPEPADRMLDERRTSDRERQWLQIAPVGLPDFVLPLDIHPADVSETDATIKPRGVCVDTAGLLVESEVTRIVDPFLHLPLGRRRIDLLLRRLDAALITAGWPTSRSRVRSFDPDEAQLEIEVVPGRIEAVHAAGLDDAAVRRALPVARGDVLSLEAVEQGVQQINRLRMYQAQVRILPGSGAGMSLLDILLSEGRPWSVAFGLDNQGTRSTGSVRTRITARFGNRLGLLDDIQLAHVRNAHSDAGLVSLTVPDGFNLWSATVSGSLSSSDIAGLDLTSRALTAVLGWNRVLSLTRERQHSIDVTLTRSTLARRLETTHLDSDHATVLRAAWTATGRGGRHHYYLEPAVSLGVPWLGATRDASGLPRAHTHHAFVKWALAAGGIIRDRDGTLEWSGQLTAQYARTSLIGAEQLHLGGFSSVRGFDEAVLSGDVGHVARVEMRFPSFWSSTRFSPVPFLHVDQGMRRMIGGARDVIASAGAGVRGMGNRLVWECVLSAPLQHDLESGRPGWRLHFSANYEI